MKSTPRRSVVRTVIFLSLIGAAGSAAVSLAPSPPRDADAAEPCRGAGPNARPAACSAAGEPPPPFDTASALALQAQARSIGEAFAQTHR